jgi:hypothetical protein
MADLTLIAENVPAAASPTKKTLLVAANNADFVSLTEVGLLLRSQGPSEVRQCRNSIPTASFVKRHG